VSEADRILVLQEGRIVEEGAPLALLASGGVFAGWHRCSTPSEGASAPAAEP
jgi:ABC-type multidrug transport system fused ATPase/permease subunit